MTGSNSIVTSTNDTHDAALQNIVIDGVRYALTFDAEFNAGDDLFWQGYGSDGVWATSHAPTRDDLRYLAQHGELQYFADPDDVALPNPFSTQDGVLSINATPLEGAAQASADDQGYVSGLLTSEMTFHMDGGYIEMRADIPAQTGLWSAFWLLPADGDWSAEIDVFEVLGESPDTLHTNLWQDGTPDELAVQGLGVGDGFHIYGLYWDEDVIRWTVDGVTIREAANTVTEEMFLALGLAVGGWAQDPDDTTDFSDPMRVDYVRVYEIEGDPDSNPSIEPGGFQPTDLPAPTNGDDTLFGSRWGDKIKARAGNDTLYGKGGDDRLIGNAGDDRLYGNEGNDRLHGGRDADHLVGGFGSDLLVGGRGNDHMWGGAYDADGASDRFLFKAGSGTDYVHDFEAGTDLIDLRKLSADWQSVEDAKQDHGWATFIDLAAVGGTEGDGLYIAGVSPEDLLADSFLLTALV